LGIRNLGRCLREAAPGAFVGIPRAQAARTVLGWAKETLRIVVSVGSRWPGARGLGEVARLGASGPPPMFEPEPGATAAILFTSGSTGPPKGVVYTHEIFNAQVDLLRELYAIEPGEVDLCTFPLFALFAPALGMTSVVPEMDATRPARVYPPRILEAIADFGVTNLFGSPALLRRVGEFGALHAIRLPTLKRVVSAGAPVPARVLETFAGLLGPDARIHTPYGATEALPVCTIASDEILGETRRATDRGAGVCVGRPVPGMRVEIIAVNDGPIARWSDDLRVPKGTIGEIAVRGPVVTRSYFQRPEATELAKVDDPLGGFWHRMGDLGYLDDQGRIWFCGRKSHRVITRNGTLYTIPCEAIFNTHPLVARTALVGVGPAGSAIPVLCVELLGPPKREDHPTIRRELLELGASHPTTASIQTILFHPAFPVDIRHNAKIFREKLALWAARRLR
jgi:acyl-CoA synthetase (AMP-forming)/AMP-acid ligase II